MPHQYFQYIMFPTNSPCSSASFFCFLSMQKKKSIKKKKKEMKEKKVFRCEGRLSRASSARSLWLVCEGLYFRGSLDCNSSLLRGLPPNSVLSINAVTFPSNDLSIPVRIQPETCIHTRAGAGAPALRQGHNPESSKPPSPLPSPPTPKCSWPQQCLEGIEFSPILLSERPLHGRGVGSVRLSAPLRRYYTPKHSYRPRVQSPSFCTSAGSSQPASQLTGESIMDNGNHEDSPSLDFDMPSDFVKIRKAKKQHLLQYRAPTESVQHQQISRNEASPYCFIHFIPNFYFYFF